jgi:putative exosortase-associated protein (TIGR04073 family)
MKKRGVFLFAVFFMLMASSSVYAADYFKASGEKAKRGVINLFTGWLEVPYQTSKGFKGGFGKEGKFKLLGGLCGIGRGFVHGIGRTASGALQIATFPFPNPKNNEGVGIPLDSTEAWEEGTQYSIANQGLAPVGRKAFRGLTNTFFGLFEVPSQLHKGFKEDHPFKGMGKAVLYSVGRLSSGVSDIVTVILPNNAEGYGYPLEEKMPWDGLEERSSRNDL